MVDELRDLGGVERRDLLQPKYIYIFILYVFIHAYMHTYTYRDRDRERYLVDELQNLG